MNLSYVAKLPTASSNLNHRFKFIRFGPWTFLVLILGSSIVLHLINYADLWINLMPIGGQLRNEALNLNLKLPALDIEIKGSTLTVLQTIVETSDQILTNLLKSSLIIYFRLYYLSIYFLNSLMSGLKVTGLTGTCLTSTPSRWPACDTWFFKNIVTHC